MALPRRPSGGAGNQAEAVLYLFNHVNELSSLQDSASHDQNLYLLSLAISVESSLAAGHSMYTVTVIIL